MQPGTVGKLPRSQVKGARVLIGTVPMKILMVATVAATAAAFALTPAVAKSKKKHPRVYPQQYGQSYGGYAPQYGYAPYGMAKPPRDVRSLARPPIRRRRLALERPLRRGSRLRALRSLRMVDRRVAARSARPPAALLHR